VFYTTKSRKNELEHVRFRKADERIYIRFEKCVKSISIGNNINSTKESDKNPVKIRNASIQHCFSDQFFRGFLLCKC